MFRSCNAGLRLSCAWGTADIGPALLWAEPRALLTSPRARGKWGCVYRDPWAGRGWRACWEETPRGKENHQIYTATPHHDSGRWVMAVSPLRRVAQRGCVTAWLWNRSHPSQPSSSPFSQQPVACSRLHTGHGWPDAEAEEKTGLKEDRGPGQRLPPPASAPVSSRHC